VESLNDYNNTLTHYYTLMCKGGDAMQYSGGSPTTTAVPLQ